MYRTIEELESLNFKELPQEERLTIMLSIIDNQDIDISQFKKYFLREDIDILKK
jgi:hypothetical protein